MNQDMNDSMLGKFLRDRLQGLSEYDLQSYVVEPLLQASGFTAVRDVSGPGEKGRDLVAVRSELGTDHFYAIQVKKLPITGRVEDPQSLMGLLRQLEQAMHEEALDPTTLSKRTPDRLVFVTPYSINRAALDAAFEKYRSVSRNQVTVIDGTTLASEVLRRIPHVASRLNPELSYRMRLKEEHSTIDESRSFGLTKPLLVRDIYVEADYTCFDDLDDVLSQFLKVDEVKHDVPPSELPRPCTKAELEHLATHEKVWAMAWGAPSWRAKCTSLEEVMASLARHGTDLLSAIASFTESEDSGALDQIHTRLIALQTATRELRNTFILPRRSHLVSQDTREALGGLHALVKRRRILTYRHLYQSTSTIVISGVAGGGKTTLLRTLVARAAEEDLMRETLFIRAVDVPDATPDGFERVLLSSMDRVSGAMTSDTLNGRLADGKLRIMVDGLDEAGDRSQRLANTLLGLAKRFPACPITVTTRETIDLSKWSLAIHIRLCAFTDDQVARFIDRWFSAKPSARDGLLHWLEQHPMMRDGARTPLIVALMCSLYGVGETLMPMSETELHDRRLDFLLGRWEEAKTIPSLPEKARSRWLLFLMHCAHTAHERQVRALQYPEMQRLAERFIAPGFGSATWIVTDCTGRGLLQAEPDGSLTLGHLVHQEFLTGKYMHKYNDIPTIQKRLGIDWWRKPLLFYASLIGDISPLIRGLSAAERKQHHRQLKELVSAATDTPADLL